MKHTLLVINPGSTSTKIAVYHDESPLFVENIEHSRESLVPFADIHDQYEMRRDLILRTMQRHGVAATQLTAVVARGGLLPPVRSGAYRVNDALVRQLRDHPVQEHAANLGAALAQSIAAVAGVDAYIYDPVTVDELDEVSRLSGLPGIERKAMCHTLNMRASAIKYAGDVGRPYGALTLIVAHLGGGITLTLHKHGRMVDMVNDEEGPFSIDRSGGLPIFQVIDLATSGERDHRAMMKLVRNHAGLEGYLGTKDAREVERRIAAGDEQARLVYEAMALQVAKSIGSVAVVVAGKVDAIILTGGIAHSALFTDLIRVRVAFIAPVVLIPGENEMQSLALGALRVLRGEEAAHEFEATT